MRTHQIESFLTVENAPREYTTAHERICDGCGKALAIGSRLVLHWTGGPRGLDFLCFNCAKDRGLVWQRQIVPPADDSMMISSRNAALPDGDIPGQTTLFGNSAKESPMPPTATAAPPAKKGKKSAAAAGTNPKAKTRKPAPPKSPLAATDEEVEAAILGTLTPREKPGARDQEALTSKTEDGRGGGRPVGVTTGLPILMAWCLAFQENAKPTSKHLPKLGHVEDKFISEFMRREFPGRDTPAFDRPQGCRNDYNNGKFTKNRKPKIQSVPYDENGKPTEPSRRGRNPNSKMTPPKDPNLVPIDGVAPKPKKKVKA